MSPLRQRKLLQAPHYTAGEEEDRDAAFAFTRNMSRTGKLIDKEQRLKSIRKRAAVAPSGAQNITASRRCPLTPRNFHFHHASINVLACLSFLSVSSHPHQFHAKGSWRTARERLFCSFARRLLPSPLPWPCMHASIINLSIYPSIRARPRATWNDRRG